jgi:NAD(P)-dependent dehydrogenase (short-subunit alcohol dehydrogenase family)
MKTTKKIAFITGANRGIGFATAFALAQKNIHVIISAQKETDGRLAVEQIRKAGFTADFITFNARNSEDIDKVYSFIEINFKKLDILINNAGVFLDAADASVEHTNLTSLTPEELLRKTFDINFFSVVLLTQKLLPLIKKSEAGRIVNVSSILGSLSLHSEKNSPLENSKYFAYDSSKSAVNAFTIHLAHELKNTCIKVNSAHPGWVKTTMGGQMATMDPAAGAETSVSLALLPASGPTGKFFHKDDIIGW